MLGTTFQVVVQGSPLTTGELYARILEIDSAMKRSMSIFDEGSLLSRINRNETDSTDCHIRYNLALAREISELSQGSYDVTVKPLIEAWGFAGKERTVRPNLDSLCRFVGYEKVWIDPLGVLHKSDPRVAIDFNSIAKGYTVDCVAAMLEEVGAENYLVDIGGEVRCRGRNSQGNPWRIGIERPVDGALLGESTQTRISLSEGALATSGNYRRFFMDEQGRKVAHTIDPRTGESVLSRLLSVTVVADCCARADALCTMYMAMGADRALALARSLPDAKVLFILGSEEVDDPGLEIYVSPALEAMWMK